jgi:dienelactone hydrolase
VGVGLCVGAAVSAVRATRGWWRLPAALAVAVATLVALQLGLMPLAAATAGVHPPRMPISGELPPGAVAVTVATPDGARLGAWYTPGTNGATVVLLPGSLGNRGDTAAHGQALVDHGYGVLALDSRGSGESDEFGNMWGWTGELDIAGALAWLDGQPAVDPARIGLVGLSMGGEQAVTFAATDAVGAVVAEGVSARVAGDLWYVSDDLRGTVERAVSTIMWATADLWTGIGPPVSLRQAASAIDHTPVLIIAADAYDERVVAADLARQSPIIEVWQTTGIGHTQALALARTEWEARVIGFLDRELLGP